MQPAPSRVRGGAADANTGALRRRIGQDHQVGGFLGAYLGGVIYQSTGSFNGMWAIDIALAAAAALIHLPIREATPAGLAAARAAA